jgi:hypothetical protein
MRLSRLILAGLFVALMTSAVVAKADGLPDPKVGFGGTDPAFAPASINTPNFSISDSNGESPAIDPNGNPIVGGSACVVTPPGGSFGTSSGCYFENDISEDGVGQSITSVVFDVAIAPGNDSCSNGFTLNNVAINALFSSCSTGSDGSGGTLFSFYGGDIAYKGDFFVALDFPDSPNGILSSVNVTTPEPGTLALLGVGLLTLFGLGRKRLFGQAQ